MHKEVELVKEITCRIQDWLRKYQHHH